MCARTWSRWLVLCLFALPEARARADAASDALRTAEAAEAEGQWPRAADVLRAALRTTPDDYGLQMAAADADRHLGAWDEAASAYRRAMVVSEGAFAPRLGLAEALLGGERYAEALDVLKVLATERADDAALLDRLALASFWLGQLADAERAYRAALALDPTDVGARVGLAWIAQRRGDARCARTAFAQVLVDHPDEALARKGLAMLGSGWSTTFLLRASASALDQGLNATTAKDAIALLPSYALTVGIDQVILDRWTVGLRYRHLGSIDFPTGLSNTDAVTPGFGQDEGHLTVGYGTPAWGVAAYASELAFQATPSADASGHSGTVVGLGGHYRVWADLLGSVTYSVYDDLSVFQGELGATLPLPHQLSLFGGARVQGSGSTVDPSAEAEVRYRAPFVDVALGGSYGSQLRPVDLATSVVYNTEYTLLWRGYARAMVPLTAVVSLSLAYEYEWYRLTTTSSTTDTPGEAGNHRLTAGLALTF